MLNELKKVGRGFGLRMNWKKTQFMKNAYSDREGLQLEGSPIAETPFCVDLERSINLENDLDDKLNRI